MKEISEIQKLILHIMMEDQTKAWKQDDLINEVQRRMLIQRQMSDMK